MSMVDVILAVAIFSFFFLYTVIFVASVHLEIKAPTKNVADRIYEMLLSPVFQLPITISSNVEIWNEAFEVPLELEFDPNSTILKGSSLVPSRFTRNLLIFPLNSTNQMEKLILYFTRNTSREARSYTTDLQATASSQFFQVNNTFFSAKISENCSFPELKSGGINVFLEGIEMRDNVSLASLDNVVTELSCQNITYRFFPSTPKIRVLTSTPINLSLQPIFTHWSTPDSEGWIGNEQSFQARKLLLYDHSSKLLFIEFDTPTPVVLKKISQTSSQAIIYNATSTTTIISGWINPANAYTSDNLRTYTSTDNAEQEYSGYGINIPSTATINKVEVGVEGYTTNPTYEDVLVYIYDGTYWYIKPVTDYSSETLQWLDFTTSTAWTPAKVNQIKTRVKYYYISGGGGCYPNFTKVLVHSNHSYSFKAPDEIRIGEEVVCWNERDGIHLCKVTGVDRHVGNFRLLNFSLANLSLVVTDNHPIPSPELNKILEAREYRPGMKLRVLMNGSISLAEISSIQELSFSGEVYDVKINESSVLFSLSNPPTMSFPSLDLVSAVDVEIKTYYVDWLPVRINYTVSQANKILIEIREPSNFSIYVANYSHELKRYYRSREIEVLAGSVQKVSALTNESVSTFIAMDYETLKSILGYGFFTTIEIMDENLNYLKGEYIPSVRRSSERRAFYFDNDFNQSLAVIRIGIH